MISVLLVEFRCSLSYVGVISRLQVAWVLALLLQFIFLDLPILLLGLSVQGYRIPPHAACCWPVGRFPFWFLTHPFDFPQLKHAILAADQPLQFLDLLECEYFPYHLQGLVYCGVGEVLTSWDWFLQSDLCKLSIVERCMTLLKWRLSGQLFPDWLACWNFIAALPIFCFGVPCWQVLPPFVQPPCCWSSVITV